MGKRIQKEKIVLLLLSLIVICAVFCGCSSKDEISEFDNSENFEIEEGEIILATDQYGGLFKNGAGVESGFYEPMVVQSNSLNVLYTDYATGVRTYLCSSPECLHNSESCTSWFSALGTVCLFTNESQTELFLLSSGYAETGTEKSDIAQGKIYKMNLDGSERTVLYQLASNEQFSGAVAISDSNIYAGVQVINPSNGKMTFEIRKINIDTSKAKSIYHTDNFNNRIVGSYDKSLVIEEVTDALRNYYMLDVQSGEEGEAKYSYDYTAEVRTEQVFGKSVYSLRTQEGTSATLYEIDLESGQERQIAQDIQIYDHDATRISDCYDGHLEIETSDNRDKSNIQLLKYQVDLTSGEVGLCPLQYEMYGINKNVPILAENETSFLVQMAVKEGTVTVVDNMGVPSEIESAIPQYALIPKADYWAGNANYSVIEETFFD